MRPPIPLIAIATIYLASELLPLVSRPTAMGVVRIAIYSIVLFFALRGSRGAANLWGVLSVFGGIVSSFSAVQLFQSNPDSSLLLALYAAFFFMGSAYIFLSRQLRSFYERSATSAGADAPQG
jgi:hypothetical protein